MRFGDEHSILAADDGAAFAQREFDDASVEAVLLRPRDGFGGRLDPGEIDEATFSLGDDLVFHDEDVARLELDAAQGLQQLVGERITGTNFIREGDGDQAEFGARED